MSKIITYVILFLLFWMLAILLVDGTKMIIGSTPSFCRDSLAISLAENIKSHPDKWVQTESGGLRQDDFGYVYSSTSYARFSSWNGAAFSFHGSCGAMINKSVENYNDHNRGEILRKLQSYNQ